MTGAIMEYYRVYYNGNVDEIGLGDTVFTYSFLKDLIRQSPYLYVPQQPIDLFWSPTDAHTDRDAAASINFGAPMIRLDPADTIRNVDGSLRHAGGIGPFIYVQVNPIVVLPPAYVATTTTPVRLVRLFFNRDDELPERVYREGVSLSFIEEDLGLSRVSLTTRGDINHVIVSSPFPAGDYDLYRYERVADIYSISPITNMFDQKHIHYIIYYFNISH
ncbi:hypothetical protein PPL_00690 [Heterostelium album PN500]|uniref:Uncharacterized protein n=1 Tax=Heterostelium pallidum (strain ATCC 26659 / Pp 5 / PN500) TaxID=670386 RepID=D3AX61_HETP5|nr:hypothetical protein PPL_00690 [Heterostelium album PN500]EFA86130.1 hypothetical protein PPL_00690 [Heterostelium album PN500]|eukprot:XP_020438235.1 hypothetical protein PPL_00690 [Heterostelium album PN500]